MTHYSTILRIVDLFFVIPAKAGMTAYKAFSFKALKRESFLFWSLMFFFIES